MRCVELPWGTGGFGFGAMGGFRFGATGGFRFGVPGRTDSPRSDLPIYLWSLGESISLGGLTTPLPTEAGGPFDYPRGRGRRGGYDRQLRGPDDRQQGTARLAEEKWLRARR